MKLQEKIQFAQQVALNFSSKRDFKKNAVTQYRLLCKHPEVYKTATAHMKNPLLIWDKEAVIKEAKKYKKAYHFQLKSKGAYWVAHQKGWLKEACAHMESISIWNMTNAFAEAKKYQFKKDFRKNSRGAFQFLWRHSKKTLDKACAHMTDRFAWTKASAIAEAKKFETKRDMREKSAGCMAFIFREKLDKIAFAHMKEVIIPFEKNAQKEFEDKIRKLCVNPKINLVMLNEFKMVDSKQYRVDLLLNLVNKNIKLAIEYKSDKCSWNKDKIEAQRKFYQKHLKKFKVQETYLVSTHGRYGLSEDQFLILLKKIIKHGKVEKYKL